MPWPMQVELSLPNSASRYGVPGLLGEIGAVLVPRIHGEVGSTRPDVLGSRRPVIEYRHEYQHHMMEEQSGRTKLDGATRFMARQEFWRASVVVMPLKGERAWSGCSPTAQTQLLRGTYRRPPLVRACRNVIGILPPLILLYPPSALLKLPPLRTADGERLRLGSLARVLRYSFPRSFPLPIHHFILEILPHATSSPIEQSPKPNLVPLISLVVRARTWIPASGRSPPRRNSATSRSTMPSAP
jgi:hypothetical protein